MTLGKMSKLLGAFALAGCALSAQALRVDSADLIPDGGALVVDHRNSESGSENGISLRKAAGSEFLSVNNGGGKESFSQPGPARTSKLPDAWLPAAFEDRIGPSDQDFSDAVFRARTVGGNLPEPASLALVGLGLVGLGLVRRRRNSGR